MQLKITFPIKPFVQTLRVSFFFWTSNHHQLSESSLTCCTGLTVATLRLSPSHQFKKKKNLERAPDPRSIAQECGVTPGSSNATTCESSDWPHEIIFRLSRCQNCFARQSQTDPSSADSSLLPLPLASKQFSVSLFSSGRTLEALQAGRRKTCAGS